MESPSVSPLPADTDLTQIFDTEVLEDLAAIIHTYDLIQIDRYALARLNGLPDDEPHPSGVTVGRLRAAYTDQLGQYAPVTALHALRASHDAAQQLAVVRHRAIRDARADGESWSVIGAALDMSKQGAQDWYNKHSLPEEQDTEN